jgi:cell division protein FtsW (lipid II flippase)/regulation of enolase protein 1 (concanavalin A-like superfamily)
MEWYNEPAKWSEDGETITITSSAKRISGARPRRRIRDSGHFYFEPVSGDFVAEVVQHNYHALYDQAGLMVRVDNAHWMKCGIEFFNGVQHASVVVTRDYSDWSVLPLTEPPPVLWLRVARHGSTFEVSYSRDGAAYTMLRQTYLADAAAVNVGVVVCAPIGDGFTATFEGFVVRERDQAQVLRSVMSQQRDLPQYIEDDEFDYAEAFSRPRRPEPSAPPPTDRERRRGYYAGIDLYLALVVGVLSAVGLLMVYSASIDVSYQVTGKADSTTYFFVRQVRSMVVGLVIMVFLVRIDYHIWRRLAVPMMFGVILLLVTVLRFGDTRFEAQRSLVNGSFQPGELAKFTVVIYMAVWLAAKRTRIRRITYGILPFSILIGTVAFLIALQPDLSTAASILATALSMFFIAGADWFQLLLIGGAMGVSGWQLLTQLDYARGRLENHWRAVEDLTQASDHIQQAVTAFINGGLTGVGLGEGQLKFSNNPPFPHTDSIFAVIGRNWGCSAALA